MQNAPATINGMPVFAFTRIDGRHRFTGNNERRVVNRRGEEVLIGPVDGLALCRPRAGDGVVLVGCDARWAVVWTTRCCTIDHALDQAEFEYEGVTETLEWPRPGDIAP